MNDTEKLLAKMQAMENSIVTRLESSMDAKIAKLTDEALQRMHNDITQTNNSVKDLGDEMETVKEKIATNTDEITRID